MFFYNCSSLEDVTFGEKIAKIDGLFVFENCDNLKQIRLESKIPPSFSRWSFSHSQLLSINIIVPDGCVDIYMQSDGWKEFLNIVDQSSAGVEDIATDSKSLLSVSCDGIFFQGESSVPLLICGIDGKCQYSGNVSPGQSIALSKGIYIVTLDGKTIKVKI